MENTDKQLCVVNVTATVDSDEEAFKLKKVVSEAVKDCPEVSVSFGLRPVGPPR